MQHPWRCLYWATKVSSWQPQTAPPQCGLQAPRKWTGIKVRHHLGWEHFSDEETSASGVRINFFLGTGKSWSSHLPCLELQVAGGQQGDEHQRSESHQSDALVGQYTFKVNLCATIAMDKHGHPIVGRTEP